MYQELPLLLPHPAPELPSEPLPEVVQRVSVETPVPLRHPLLPKEESAGREGVQVEVRRRRGIITDRHVEVAAPGSVDGATPPLRDSGSGGWSGRGVVGPGWTLVLYDLNVSREVESLPMGGGQVGWSHSTPLSRDSE